MNGQDERY